MPEDKQFTTYADPAVVIDRWIGSDKPDDWQLVADWLEDAEHLLFTDRELTDLRSRLDDESTPAAVAAGVQLAKSVALVERLMVMRALKNPDNERQITTGTGPYQDSVTRAAESMASLEVTAEDRARLGSSTGSRAGTASTLPAEFRPQFPLAGAWVNGPGEWAPGFEP